MMTWFSSSRRATSRPQKLGLPFTHWSLRKLAAYLARNPAGERLQQILHAHGISFQRTRTWKESADPDKDAKLDLIEHVTSRFPDRCFAFDQFGPLSIRPCHGTCCPRLALTTDVHRITHRSLQRQAAPSTFSPARHHRACKPVKVSGHRTSDRTLPRSCAAWRSA